MDFALWKAAKAGRAELGIPVGQRPPRLAHRVLRHGTAAILGETIDIHCGGQDLIFPHHENEIAQSECCNGVVCPLLDAQRIYQRR